MSTAGPASMAALPLPCASIAPLPCGYLWSGTVASSPLAPLEAMVASWTWESGFCLEDRRAHSLRVREMSGP